MPTFAARRSYRPYAIVSGIGFLIACGALAVAFAVSGATDLAPIFGGLGAVGYFISTIVAIIPAKVTVGVSGKTLTWWGRPIEIDRVDVCSWVMPGVGVSTGLAVVVHGRAGRVRIGGEAHDGDGYRLTGPAQRTVDCQLPKSAFDALLEALGVAKGDPGPLVVPLVANAQTFGGVVRTMAPWFVAIAILGIGGAVIGNTAWGRELGQSPEGQLGMAIGAGVLAVAAIVVMTIRGRRVNPPAIELGFEADALIVTEQGAVTRVPWREVAVEKYTYSVSSRAGTYAMPVLAIRAGAKELRLGALDTQLAWPGSPNKTWRAPRWLVAAPKWPKLVDELRHASMS